MTVLLIVLFSLFLLAISVGAAGLLALEIAVFVCLAKWEEQECKRED